ncbi:hypothetical protein FA95DRAFT_1486884 [Auriscalpium vulgare]|uniref:Uncharacterized protein n=1 Tax=Auriscalpium vulgare TaxID=40419 RepID=A0ACB8S2M5_9AGAM|nr:hypothetical protein FA95DRAFT_1486884 [Auriscalpium vulgare]
MPLADLMQLRSTCRWWRNNVDRHVKNAVHKELRAYVITPHAFRNVLRASRAVISGSWALGLAMRRTDQGDMDIGDMDVYTPLSSQRGVVGYLRFVEGYQVVRVQRDFDSLLVYDDLYHCSSIEAVTAMVHPVTNRKIDVIAALNNAPLQPVRHFWTTALTNYVSADSICITYPNLTLNGIGCINPDAADDDNIDVLSAKYSTRGFAIGTFEHNKASRCRKSRHGYCPHTMRHFGDSHCLTLEFDTTSPQQLQPTFPTAEPMWRYAGWKCGGRCPPGNPNSETVLVPYTV